jgi:transcriptional regulator of NAD metabolism
MDNITGSEGEPLSSLTGGVHLHTLEVRDEASWKKILRALEEKNYLPDEK